MKISEKEAKLIITKVLAESYAPEGVQVCDPMSDPDTIARIKKYFKDNEIEVITEDDDQGTVFNIDPNDTNKQAKIDKITSDSSIYDPLKDKVEIGGAPDNINESHYKKSDVLKLMAEAKLKKKKAIDDQLNAVKKADREWEFQEKGPGFHAKQKIHASQKGYDRKRDKKDFSVNENVFTKQDIETLILEKKYNGKVYSKSELMETIKNEK